MVQETQSENNVPATLSLRYRNRDDIGVRLSNHQRGATSSSLEGL